MLKNLTSVLLIACCLLPASALADECPSPERESGVRCPKPPATKIENYVALDGHRGNMGSNLKIIRNPTGKHLFSLSSNYNCHVCKISGILRGEVGYATYTSMDERDFGAKKICKVRLERKGDFIDFSEGTCAEKNFCGFRGSFGDRHLRVPPRCNEETILESTQKEVEALLQARQYNKAIALIEPILNDCSNLLTAQTKDQLRDDLASAQLAIGHPQACLQTLEKAALYAITAEISEPIETLADYQDAVFPCEYDLYGDVAARILKTKAACEHALKTQKTPQPMP